MGGNLDSGIAFGKVLRKLRLEAGLTQEEFGFEADLRGTYVSILELGQQQPSLTTIFKIAKWTSPAFIDITQLPVCNISNAMGLS